MPALSVILPNYNHAKFLDRAITAFLDQSFRDFELIIVDDASTDDSVSVIEKYVRADSRVTLHRNPENKGVIFTLNRALAMAKSEWVMGAASDDYILPGYFRESFKLLEQHPEAGICLGLCAAVNEKGEYERTTPGYWSSAPEYIPPNELIHRIGGCGVPGPVIWHRQAFLDAGGYIPELRWHGDWFTLQVVAFRRGVCFLPFRTSVVRNAADSYSAGQARSLEQRDVLRHMLRLLADPKYADVRPAFRDSVILCQFGIELIRVAVTEPDLSPVLPEMLRRHVFDWSERLLRDPSSSVAIGMARMLAGYGAEARGVLPFLNKLPGNTPANVRAAAAEASRTIRRSEPVVKRALRGVRDGIGNAVRAVERFLRPLHHERLKNIEALLRDIRDNAAHLQPSVSHLAQQLDDILTRMPRAAEKQ